MPRGVVQEIRELPSSSHSEKVSSSTLDHLHLASSQKSILFCKQRFRYVQIFPIVSHFFNWRFQNHGYLRKRFQPKQCPKTFQTDFSLANIFMSVFRTS